MTGVHPLGAQVRTRVGRSLIPDSSTKTITRPSRWAFFERGPSAPLPLAHCIFIALQGALLGLLHTETQRSENSPELGCAKPDAIQTLDDHAHSLERPEISAKAVLGRALQYRTAHPFKLWLIQLGWPATGRDCA